LCMPPYAACPFHRIQPWLDTIKLHSATSAADRPKGAGTGCTRGDIGPWFRPFHRPSRSFSLFYPLMWTGAGDPKTKTKTKTKTKAKHRHDRIVCICFRKECSCNAYGATCGPLPPPFPHIFLPCTHSKHEGDKVEDSRALHCGCNSRKVAV